ncbi:MAG: hypothetical protein IPI83_13820 [Sphingomonadales bacterium]|nr:hypothetical protein [Sphingomonadales bacterium]
MFGPIFVPSSLRRDQITPSQPQIWDKGADGGTPNQGFETDGTTLFADDFIVDRGFIKSFNQELRVSNGGDAQFRWVLGGNYEKSHVYEYQLQTFSQISTAAIFGYTGAYVYTDQHMRNYAFFANGEYDLGDKITLKAGTLY